MCFPYKQPNCRFMFTNNCPEFFKILRGTPHYFSLTYYGTPPHAPMGNRFHLIPPLPYEVGVATHSPSHTSNLFHNFFKKFVRQNWKSIVSPACLLGFDWQGLSRRYDEKAYIDELLQVYPNRFWRAVAK